MNGQLTKTIEKLAFYSSHKPPAVYYLRSDEQETGDETLCKECAEKEKVRLGGTWDLVYWHADEVDSAPQCETCGKMLAFQGYTSEGAMVEAEHFIDNTSSIPDPDTYDAYSFERVLCGAEGLSGDVERAFTEWLLPIALDAINGESGALET